MKTLITFDIDGTLLKFGGNSAKHPIAFQMAFSEMFTPIDLPEKYLGKRLEGATDLLLATEMIKKFGVTPTPSLLKSFQTRVEEIYDQIFTEPSDLTPGIQDLLEQLSQSDNYILALATGNYKRIALKKLKLANLDKYFQPLIGGFGDNAYSKSEIVLEAAQDAEANYSNIGHRIHIGDTPDDVNAAINAGFFPLAVRTGRPNTIFPACCLVMTNLLNSYDKILQMY